jgi:outer membrane protein OmpA-like peptidoglycan-associated protein
MKTIILFIGMFLFSQSHGQLLKKITDKAKEKLEKKNDKPAGETTNNKDEKKVNETKDANTTPETNSNQPASIKTYSKYDFVPGEKILVSEDFMQDAIGDFPAKWNTNTSGEIVTIDGKTGRWFKMVKGVYMPDFIDSLPADFTLEFDLLTDAPVHSWGIFAAVAEMVKRDDLQNWSQAPNYFSLNLLPGTDGNGSTYYHRKRAGSLEPNTSIPMSQFRDITRTVHVAMWRQKERMRVYLNEDKTWDVPKAILPEAKLNALLFFIQLTDKWNFYMSNLRLAVGAPDTRKKILEQNKWVTHGILFDVNSDKIIPQSYGTLKEMANVLKEYADLKVKIIGHTDADGADAANLDLSKRRAASVKTALAKEFGIDESRMETDGKGESEPIDKNDTPAGKANNRRVEFIKL